MRNRATQDQRRTTCKMCNRGIFLAEETVWAREHGFLGLVHADCWNIFIMVMTGGS